MLEIEIDKQREREKKDEKKRYDNQFTFSLGFFKMPTLNLPFNEMVLADWIHRFAFALTKHSRKGWQS